MPDISMCLGSSCDDRKKCYRYMAFPSDRQSYMVFGLDIGQDEECPDFWDIADAPGSVRCLAKEKKKEINFEL